MKDHSFKYKKNKEISPARLEWITKHSGGDECKLQFLLWAEGTWLEVYFNEDGTPCYRPAICAWEAWKAAWSLRGTGASHGSA